MTVHMRYGTTGLVCIAAIAALRCTVPGPQWEEGATATGRWGGVHASLILTDSGGTIEYDCAHGGIGVATRPARDGRFDVSGVHVREHGGPVRVGEVPDSVPAKYSGQISGDRMTLRVLIGADTLGVFELRRNADAQLFKCL